MFSQIQAKRSCVLLLFILHQIVKLDIFRKRKSDKEYIYNLHIIP